MWQLTYRGKGIGQKYPDSEEVIKAYIRLYPSFLGLGWHEWEEGNPLTA